MSSYGKVDVVPRALPHPTFTPLAQCVSGSRKHDHMIGDGMATAFKSSTADTVEAIGMRVLRIAEDMTSQSRHHGRSERLIEDVEQAANDLRAAVRGR